MTGHLPEMGGHAGLKYAISLVPEDIVEKIIGNNRGGDCYEVNRLFAMALDALGIEYQFVAATPLISSIGRQKTHMAIIAKVDGGRWLCDLGFGGHSICASMDLADCDKTILQGQDTFMLKKSEDGEYLLLAYADQAWMSQYIFDLTPWQRVDFAQANYFNSANPDAIFPQKRLVSLQNLAGRTILSGNSLKTIQNGIASKVEVEDEQITMALKTFFDLSVSS